ncbi:MAG: nucleotidyl transferase AbiEii/AbiGii toxin family protein [Burkholderiaceae bacterium]|nr:nucleotidyl transferase AbiEii/AbiGii toxin family protein [Burkholderiaceae bacterium]
MTANRAASIRARLKQHADTTKEDFNLVLTRYGTERLLYRLATSEHATQFVLKGALLFALWYGQPHRPTRDADLLGFGPDDPQVLAAVFQSLCAMPVDDGMQFDSASIRVGTIRTEARYGGVRVDIRATLDNARIALQVDVGFGDAVTPAPPTIIYPSLLPDVPTAPLRVYPKATVVAEKLHAVCILGLTNSRMKDYFDLDLLLHDPEVDDAELRSAVTATFQQRQSPVPAELPIGLSDAFAADPGKRTQWTAFLRKNRLDALQLEAVVRRLRERAAMIGIPAS